MDIQPLPIRLDDLLDARKVESDRLEFKQGWNPPDILRSICAFANDFHNYGGGYIIIGVAQDADGRAVLPPVGVPAGHLDKIQRELLRYCNLIRPAYFPILGAEEVAGRTVLILWCPGGQNRPYQAPRDVTAREKEYAHFIRRYANTVVAKDGELQELMTLTAKIPFDDRINHHAALEDLQAPRVSAFLKEVGSALHGPGVRMPFPELARRMAIVDGPDEYLRPRNVGLLFFNEAPERFFPGAYIDVVQFPEGVGGSAIQEQTFRGPIQTQVRDALRHLRNVAVRERVTKRPDRAESDRVASYPFAALEEALVNAVYHRGYDQREPIVVRVNPDGIEIVSYPGPDPSIRREQLAGERIVARRYRNRRIGEFLKELDLTEGRSTGIPKIRASMAANGSPPPAFETDDERTFFLVRLPLHPDFAEAGVEAGVEALEGLTEAEAQILRLLRGGPKGTKDIAIGLGQRRGGGKASGGLKKALDHLTDLGFISLTKPEKPTSKTQKRKLTDQGARLARKLP